MEFIEEILSTSLKFFLKKLLRLLVDFLPFDEGKSS